MSYTRSLTVQRSGDFQRKQYQLCKGPNNVQVEKIMFKMEKMFEKIRYYNKTIQQQDDSINQLAKNYEVVKFINNCQQNWQN